MLRELNTPSNQKFKKRKIKSNKIIKNNSSTNNNIIKIGLENSLSPSHNSTLGDTPNYSKIDKKSINSNHSKKSIKSIIFNKEKRDNNNDNFQKKIKNKISYEPFENLIKFEKKYLNPLLCSYSHSSELKNFSFEQNKNKKKNSFKKKYMNQFLRCISQDNMNKKINDNDVKKAKNEYDDNLKNLSNLIDEINNKGFKRNASLLIEKKNKINTLTESLSHLNFELNQSRRNLNKSNISSSKTICDNDNIKKQIESVSKERKQNSINLKKIRNAIQIIPGKIKNLRKETMLIKGETFELLNKTKNYENEIQKLNLFISKSTRNLGRIGSMRTSINKGIGTKKNEINDCMKSTNNFMIDVYNVVDNENIFYKE